MQVVYRYVKLLLPVSILLAGSFALAASIEELKSKIVNKSDEVKQLEAKITELGKNVEETKNIKKNLNTELRQIDAVSRRLASDVKITAGKVDLTNFTITKFEKEIEGKSQKIADGSKAISDSLRLTSETDSSSLPEKVLSDLNFSSLWNQISELIDFQSKLASHVGNLKEVRSELESDKKNLESEKKQLIKLKDQLSDQQKIAQQNIVSKNKLIKDTSNKEANFKKLLAETEARKRGVENELLFYESELRVTIDPTSLPSSGTKVLSWPLDLVAITQYFGNTAFAMSHSIYNGKGHNGIDLRAPIGTPLKAALSGTVVGTGDTDPVCYGASYGKWVMIEHGNGLATIYGHLSLIKVSANDKINTGDLIGYTGRSGYATGPHLHFTVAAIQAVKIGNLKSKVKGCGTYTIPLGPFNGYLNPLLYL